MLDIIDESQLVVRHYLVITFLLAAGQSAVIGVAMWWLGMPNPILWAIFSLVMEFIPYLGGAVCMIMLTIVAFGTV